METYPRPKPSLCRAKRPRLLVVTHRAEDVDLLGFACKRAGLLCDIVPLRDLKSLNHALETPPDMVLIDCYLRRSYIAEAVKRLRDQHPRCPVLVLSPQMIVDGVLRAQAAVRQALLSEREREILQMIAEGRSTKQVAQRLGISVKTAETHRTNLMKKIGARSVVDLVRYAVRNEIVPP